LVGSSRDTCRAYFAYFLAHWSHDPKTFDDELEAWVDNFMLPGNLQGGFNYYLSANAGRLAAMRGEAGPPEKIRTRTHVLWGRHDPVLKSEWSDVLGETFTDFTLDFAENSAHFVHYEEPDLAAREIEKFFG
jgi:pimeloyl-ACP methyl ester carboxylesterase